MCHYPLLKMGPLVVYSQGWPQLGQGVANRLQLPDWGKEAIVTSGNVTPVEKNLQSSSENLSRYKT